MSSRTQLGVVALVTAAACSGAAQPTAKRQGTVRVRVFTETSPVRHLEVVGPYLFAASARGLDRWDLATGAVLPLSAEHGLTGNQVLGLAADAGRGWMWIATAQGVVTYDASTQIIASVPPPPQVLGIDLAAIAQRKEPLALAAAAEGGLWIGTRRGLYFTNPKGQWTATGVTDPVSSIHVGEDGWLWIATAKGLVGRSPKGESLQIGGAEGCRVTRPKLVTRGLGGGVLVYGLDSAGRPTVALRRSGRFQSYSITGSPPWTAAAPVGDDVVVLAGDRLYQISAKARGVPVPDPAAFQGDDAPALQRLPTRLPSDATAIVAHNGELLVGSLDLGVARFSGDAAAPSAWLRSAEMLAHATALTVSCDAADDCYLATGTRGAWHWDGSSFEPIGPLDQLVLAMVKGRDGKRYGLHRGPDAKAITVSRIDGDQWTAMTELRTPGTAPTVSFARFAPNGLLWVGLLYKKGEELTPWGVATIDVQIGVAAYHHASRDRRDRKRGILPVPVNVVDAAFFDEEVWMATTEGAARLEGEQVTLWTEAEGLASESVRGVASTPGGLVFVATGAGVGQFDGNRWVFAKELRLDTHDIEVTADGRLWLATDRGLATYDGRSLKTLDRRRGLVDDKFIDVVIDELGRVWARGEGSLTVVTP